MPRRNGSPFPPDYPARVAELATATTAATATAPVPNGNGAEPDEAIRPWPSTPAPAAFGGVAGDVVELIAPHTEADPVGVLVHFLVGFGNAAGKSPHFAVGATAHHVNLFALVVGATSTGAKGTAWDEARRVLRGGDLPWTEERVHGGIGSGEGLIKQVRDATYETKEVRDRLGVRTETVCTDPGVSDKRALFVETEFRRTLAVAAAKGSILSSILRQAWDGGTLQQVTKGQPLKATRPHVSLIGHITPDELRVALDTVDVANGLVNRFLITCVRMQRYLPDGGSPPAEEMERLGGTLSQLIRYAQSTGEMGRTPAARELWHAVYPELRQGRPGLLGAVTSRAAPQVLRLACLYALLDASPDVDAGHLRSALALWDYCVESVNYVFGDALGDPDVDRLWAAFLEPPHALAREVINRDVFQGNVAARRIKAALTKLAELRWVACEKEERKGLGRKKEVWRVVPGTVGIPPGIPPSTSLNPLLRLPRSSGGGNGAPGKGPNEATKETKNTEYKKEEEEERERVRESIEERLAIRVEGSDAT